MKKGIRKAIAVFSSAAIAASLCAAPMSAFAAGGLGGKVGDTTSWKVPSSQMKNIVTLGSGENAVPHKVITTWANAWALSGPDYLGVANSGTLNQQGGGAGSTSLANAQNDTLLGIWASSANEVPNAYNWNYFYNLALTESGDTLVDTAAVDVQNGANAGFDSESGVWAAFKYRPEIIWTSNSLNATNAAKYAGLIKAGKYVTKTGAKWSADNVTVDDNGVATDGNEGDAAATLADDASAYALYNDSAYRPYIMSATNSSPLTFTNSFYTLAENAEKVVKDTEKYGKEYSADGDTFKVVKTTVDGDNGTVMEAKDGDTTIWKVDKTTTTNARTGQKTVSYDVDTSGVNWKTMNYLPRTTRYEASAESPMSARECALAVEKISRGAVYYVLGAIDDGKVAKKKVAFLTGDPSNGTATVVAYDFTDQIGGGPTGGKTGVSSLVVDQLTTDTPQGTEVEGASPGYVGYKYYTASADDLAACDYVVDANGSMTTNQVQSWVAKNVSSYTLKQRALNDVQYLTNSPAIMNAHNFTTEKMIWGAFNIDFFYPELFPNMELTTWWYDNIYHLNYGNVKQAMQWGLANASLPAETDLASLGKGYSTADVDAKVKDGYDYYRSAKGKLPYSDEAKALLEPSDTFKQWADSEVSLPETISVTGKTSYSKSATDAAFKLDAKASVSGAEMAYKSDNAGVATVDATGKVTLKGAGTANITVTASKARYVAGSMVVKVTVKAAAKAAKAAPKAQTITVKTVKKTYKAKKLKKKAASFKIGAKAKTGLSYKVTKKDSKKKVTFKNGKVKVKKGAKKGTYKVKVKISAKASSAYKAASKTVTIKVKVK